MSSALDAILSNLGVEFKLNAAEHPSFISGRTAKILLKNKNIGFIGEVNPEVLNNWGLSMPTTGFEIDVIPLFS
jgi:phenylalanyl-tRNA synthetase beta chain